MEKWKVNAHWDEQSIWFTVAIDSDNSYYGCIYDGSNNSYHQYGVYFADSEKECEEWISTHGKEWRP